MNVEIAIMVTEYMKKLGPEDARDLLMVTMMPLVCVVIEDLIEEALQTNIEKRIEELLS